MSYCKDNLLRHNLDVMHIETNNFDNLFNTMMDVEGKIKDNPKTRINIKEMVGEKSCGYRNYKMVKYSSPKLNFFSALDEKRGIL